MGETKRALILVGEGYGNIIMATPMIDAVHQLGYEVHVYVDGNYPDAGMLLAGWGAIEHIWDDIEKVRKRTWDVVVGSVWRRGNQTIPAIRRVVPDTMNLRNTHEAVANLTAATQLGWASHMPAPHCEYGNIPPDLPDCRYVAFCPGYGGRNKAEWARKKWPHWESLRKRIDEPVVALAATGGLWEPWACTCQCYAGTLHIRQAAAVLRAAECVVTIDNGLAHMAAALGVKTVVLFGATNEVKNRPLGRDVQVVTADMKCRPCQMTDGWNSCTDWRCMKQITPEMVKDAMR